MTRQVTPSSRAPVVLVRVSPQVLGDALAVALEAEGIEVVRHHAAPAESALAATVPPDAPPDAAREATPATPAADLAVVTGLAAGEVIADTVIELEPSGHTFVVTRQGQGGELAVGDTLGVLLAVVERLVGGPVDR